MDLTSQLFKVSCKLRYHHHKNTPSQQKKQQVLPLHFARGQDNSLKWLYD